MRVALCGATGRAGSRIMNELLIRSHQVLAIIRPGGKTLPAHDNLTAVEDDLSNATATARIIEGTDALISAYAPPADNPDELVPLTRRLIEAVTLAAVPRFIMVGGPGSLEVSPGVTLVDSGNLPLEWLPLALAHGEALKLLRSSSISWTSLSPAIYFDPGERTGKYRLGTDDLIVDGKGESRISMEDYAVAMVDELEAPKHLRQRFSIGNL